ncbi:RNA polymerase sigma factor [Micromonospora sp. RP3T]|uniref:RNA polymerase sigma factor n=1 Tax=Micromonospora sp. RP3T TaxID=2135446 RepID=UPI000D1586A3|nr:RNA polymerase sigma factor [Micromonospora sp. RP3T]PTA43222.1 RNA polymerase subunit sigma-70 [Micromonospora sp. RP3T]
MVIAAIGAEGGVPKTSDDDVGDFARLYDRYAGALYRYACQRVGEHVAEDVVADTFLAAFQQRDSYDPGRAEIRPWLFGILTRKLARHHRTERTRYRALARSAVEVAVGDLADDVTTRVAAAASHASLARALGRLSAGDRDVLLLIAWCDFTYEEVAAAVGIPLGTVRSRLNRARRRVREALGGTDPSVVAGSGDEV